MCRGPALRVGAAHLAAGLLVTSFMEVAALFTCSPEAPEVSAPALLQRSWRPEVPVLRKADDEESNEGRLPWFSRADSKVPCNVSTFAPGYHRCAAECPFLAPDVQTSCHWFCVPEGHCGDLVADAKREVCRHCRSPGCSTCLPGKDACKECFSGYILHDGHCFGRMAPMWIVVFVVSGVLFVVVLAWYIQVLCRPAVNTEGLEAALQLRWNSTLHELDSGGDSWYSLFSNLAVRPSSGRAPIGGPGLILFFRFQLAVLLWVVLAILAWVVLAFAVESDMLLVGTFAVEDEQAMCQAVRWGRGVRDRISHAKLNFTIGLYVLSTVGALALGVWQKRTMRAVDSETCTTMDFALFVYGLPSLSGPGVEAEVQDYVRRISGCSLVGVSICWDFTDKAAEVQELVERDVRRRVVGPSSSTEVVREESTEHHHFARTELCDRWCVLEHMLWRLVLGGRAGEQFSEDAREADKHEALTLLSDMKTSNVFVAVFSTERDRDNAFKAMQGAELSLFRDEYRLQPALRKREPSAILWHNVALSKRSIAWGILKGVIIVVAGIIVWTSVFYTPFAWYVDSSYRSMGKPPAFWASTAFSMIVVVGNQLMYLLCAFAAERVGFHTENHMQACYLIFYTLAVVINTVVDIGLVIVTTYEAMSVEGVRTREGTLVSELPTAMHVFRSYPMMKVLGSTLYDYNFPACFLVPFVMEGIFTIVLPYHVAFRLIRGRRLHPTTAEVLLAPIPFDLSRYADLIINLTLTAFCFFTASGWIIRNLGGLFVGCVFVYLLDHVRVLRFVRNFYICGGHTDIVAQQLLALPCGVFAASILFQLQGLGYMVSAKPVLAMLLVFLFHVALHIAFVRTLVPWLAGRQHQVSSERYEEAAENFPRTYFNSNPVHCLRSIYLHQHEPPCVYYVPGKEQALTRNEALGVYYSGSADPVGKSARTWRCLPDTRQVPMFLQRLTGSTSK